MRKINERGEIINDREPESSSSQGTTNYLIYPTAEQRNQFLSTTLIGSSLIYGFVGVVLNQVLEIYIHSFLAFILGGLFGSIVTAVYDFSYSKQCDLKDYAMGLGLPGVILIALGIGFVILIILFALFILAGLASGGG